MAEAEFLAAMAAYLNAAGRLAPAPASVDVAEPVQPGDLPAVVLSLDSVQRLGSGLGERSALIENGALEWTATIDLAHPVLPEEPTFNLLSDDRKELILPHGGLRRADGSAGSLGSSDLTVTVAGTALAVGTQVNADPAIGMLTFNAPLPAAGVVVVTYFLGQWERRVTEIAGVLRVDVRDSVLKTVSDLSASVVTAVLRAGQGELKGLRKISVTSLSSVGLPDAQRADSRGRTALFHFDYEHEVNRPDSSGGVIQRIPITATLRSADEPEQETKGDTP